MSTLAGRTAELVQTVLVAVGLLVVTAVVARTLQFALDAVGLAGLARGTTGPLVVAVAFVAAFALVFGSYVWLYREAGVGRDAPA